jgi:carbamoyltransferase
LTAQALVDSKAVGWHQGRMEFGPRALGGRSILADPRSPIVQKQLNLKVKYRESFRPFAPSVLREDLTDWFQADVDSPYMLLVADVAKDKQLEMTEEQKRLFELTGCPVLVNTSFNVRGEPIVCTPEDAFNCLMGTDIEFLAVGNCILKKEDQDKSLIRDYKNEYELD